MSAPAQPTSLRQLDTAGAKALVELLATFENLQTVLRACERLMTELGGERDEVVLDALWTAALLNYGRCFGPLTEDDVTASVSAEAVQWHRLLVQLRDRSADPSRNPREAFTVGVAQDDTGAAAGVGISSVRQPLVDDVTVRQTGAIAFALSGRVDEQIVAQQAAVFDEVRDAGRAVLDKLPAITVG